MNRTSLTALVGVSAAAAGVLLWGNTAITTTEHSVFHRAVPRPFDGFRIAHITDFHNTAFGKDHHRLLTKLQEAKPDIIAITGDMIDARRTDIPTALGFAAEAVKLAPCYYVMGNHEARIPSYPEFEEGLRKVGVHVLRNESVQLEREGEYLTVIGIDDPSASDCFAEDIIRMRKEARGFTLLLSHRPERFETYCAAGVHLALCGHAHGGQVRIPFLGGVIAPHQGFFPKYDSGVYKKGDTRMILSRGLGNSLCPLRVNNRPELIVAELCCE
ncbi:MAG: metallophosphoesterase [Oscillospiraceae bacterium]|nr:metallophosphoesterase [Oscillospiraceae bacterium]